MRAVRPTYGFALPIGTSGTAHIAHVEARFGGADKDAQVIVESCQRDTATAIVQAALRLPENAVMLVIPLDGEAHIEVESITPGECGVARSPGAIAFAGRWPTAQPT